MGGGTTTSQTSLDPESKKTVKLEREQVLQPTISAFMPQLLQGLLGRTPQNQLPVVQSQVGGIRSGTSNALWSIKNMLARYGLTGTPFGARQLAETTAGGEQQAAGVGPNMAAQLFQLAPGIMSQTGSAILNAPHGSTTTTTGPSGIGGLLGSLGGAGLFAGPSWLSALGYGGAGAGAGAAGAGAGAAGAASMMPWLSLLCWIASTIFGPSSPKVTAARYWISKHWPSWAIKLYAKYGERLSKSRIAVKLLEPLFTHAARKGGQKLYATN